MSRSGVMERVGAAMSCRAPVATRPGARASEAEHDIVARGVHYAIVRDDEGALIGLVSEHELLEIDGDALVGLCLGGPVMTVSASATLEEAAAIMRAYGVECLAVTAGALVVGIVTANDLREMGLPRSELEEPIAEDELGVAG